MKREKTLLGVYYFHPHSHHKSITLYENENEKMRIIITEFT